jgi:hypothetical protein
LATERDAPGFGIVGGVADELADAVALGALRAACVGQFECGGFDQQEAAHHGFGDAEPGARECVIAAHQRVAAGEIFGIAEQRAEHVKEMLRDQPERAWGGALDFLCWGRIVGLHGRKYAPARNSVG